MRLHSHRGFSRGSLARVVVSAAAAILFLAPGAFAQSGGGGDISEDELGSFAAALEDVQEIRQDTAEETQQAVGDSPLEQQRFQELYQARQNGRQQGPDETDAESRQFDELMGQIQQIQQGSRQQMVEAVEDEGLSVERFNQIAQSIQQNPELQQQFREMQSGSGS